MKDTILSKIIGKDSEHLSRFHDRRGERASVRTVSNGFASLSRRLRPSEEKGPWMVPSAIGRIDGLLNPSLKLLELGSGQSTKWYASRVNTVVSIEPDDIWFGKISRQFGLHSNVRLISGVIEDLLPKVLAECQFDIVVIDHSDAPSFTRAETLSMVTTGDYLPKIIVLDDSDRAEYRESISLINGWDEERYTGFRARPLRISETTLFLESSSTGP